jgi:hypothetical protein
MDFLTKQKFFSKEDLLEWVNERPLCKVRRDFKRRFLDDK